MKAKPKKFKLGKQTVSVLTGITLSHLNGGNDTWTITTTLASLVDQTCRCTFPPKCTSDNAAM